MELVHERGFANASIAGDEHELCCAVSNDSIKGGEQRRDLVLPAVKLLRRHETVRHVAGAEWEWFYAAMGLPFRQALPQIDHKTRGGLVAVLRILGEEHHHNRGERFRDARDPLVRRRRLAGNVAMHPLHRIGGGEGQFACQHFVKGDPSE
jgi:hypothetical protein